MGENFHIIIAGDERKPISIRLSTLTILVSSATIFLVASILFSTGFFTTGLYAQNKLLAKNAASAKAEMNEALALKHDMEDLLAQKMFENEKAIREIKAHYNQRIAKLAEEHSLFIDNHNEKVALINTENIERMRDLKREHDAQVAAFKKEKEILLATAVSQLNARSKFIEDVITDIGIDIRPPVIKQSSKNKGGPFIAAEDSNYDELLYRADNYIEKMQTLPLGRPINSSVSSWFGKRRDPLNRRSAFHEGIDFRGRTGDPIVATADGRVVYAGRNGGYGNFIKIRHGGGFTTCFAHLHKINVRSGEHVSRGQIIGTVGNSGRSTGPHLHYEVQYKGRPVNPAKFMKVANLTCRFNMPSEKK